VLWLGISEGSFDVNEANTPEQCSSQPISVTARCKAWVCGCLLAGIAGSNPAGRMEVLLLWVLCVVR
jgi:hypothetical protein